MNLMKANLVLAVAAAALAVPTVLTLRGESDIFVDVAHVPLMFEGFTADLVASIALGEPKKEQQPPPANADPNAKPAVQYDQLTFQRGDKGFVLGQGSGELTGAPVNREQLDQQIVKHLSEIRVDKNALVLPDATDEQLAEYGLDLEHAFVVKAGNAQGQVIAELLVGKEPHQGTAGGPDVVRGVFVRRGDSRDVVLYEAPYFMRQMKPEAWIDRMILRTTADKIQRVAIKNQSGECVFERAKGATQWTCKRPPEGKAAVRQVEVEGVVQRCAYLQLVKFVRPRQSATLNAWGLAPSELQVGIDYDKDGQDANLVLDVGHALENAGERYATFGDSPFVVTISSSLVTPFERNLGELFDPAATAPASTTPDPAKDGAGGGGEAGKEQPAITPSATTPDAPKDPPKDAPGDAPKDGVKKNG